MENPFQLVKPATIKVRRTDPENKDLARLRIIQEANSFRLRTKGIRGFTSRGINQMFGPRHIQQAVCVCRRNNLVPAEVLKLAGFRSKERR